MSLAVITPPATGLITIEDAKAHLHIEDDASDDLLQLLILAASGMIEGPYGWLGRAVITQTLQLTRDSFYCVGSSQSQGIPLPCAPVQSVTSVKYDDSAADEQTLDPEVYRLSEDSLWLTVGSTWPAVASQSGAVRIQYVAGFGDIDEVPYPIRAAALLMVGNLWNNREAVSDKQPFEMPLSMQALLTPYRVVTV